MDNQTGQPFEEGDIIKRKNLANLVRKKSKIIKNNIHEIQLVELANAKNPLKLFYKGSIKYNFLIFFNFEGKIAKKLSAEIKENGGEIGFQDFEQYELGKRRK